MTETKINARPHMRYVHEDMKKRKILLGSGDKPSKRWVVHRITNVVNSVLVLGGMNNVSQLLFAYELRRRTEFNSSKKSILR